MRFIYRRYFLILFLFLYKTVFMKYIYRLCCFRPDLDNGRVRRLAIEDNNTTQCSMEADNKTRSASICSLTDESDEYDDPIWF